MYIKPISLFSIPDALLLSSCDKLLERESDVLKRNLAVRFDGEAGMVSDSYFCSAFWKFDLVLQYTLNCYT